MLSKYPFVRIAQIASVRHYDMVEEGDVKDFAGFLERRRNHLQECFLAVWLPHRKNLQQKLSTFVSELNLRQ